ncbi:unnamed protein product [Orchesella dallaii]|uniref:FERM domain-containing protein n=1 Tax=Orchesella dallaii TaxID=48710 RepID=A0ABP1REU5_9HEXA
MYEPHGRGSKSLDRPYLVRRSHSTPCSESDNNLEHGSGSSGSNVPVRSQSNKRVIPPYARGASPPNTPNKLGGSQGKLNQNNKLIALKIVLLDESITMIQAQSKALGRVVFDQVCKQLNVLEADYFGLEYSSPGNSSTSASSTAASSPPPLSASNSILNSSILSSSNTRSSTAYWLDLEKRLTRQVAFNVAEPVLRFSVKFYTPDPSQLEEEFTRYLFSLQIKRDLQAGILVCNDNTAALMASYIVQAECGDFSEEDYPDASYLSMYKFIPHQDYEIERKIRENHKKHIGQSPAEADLHLLETARRTELYGIRMHPARDEDGISLNLSVCHNGLLVFQNFTKINTFSWAKIRKLSFKRKRFILKLHPEISDGYYKDLVEFIFDSRNECKAYWKRCVEHHAFFRCEKAPNPIHRSKGLLSSRGSSFRYSGRTQKQMVQFVRENFVKRPTPMGGPQTGGMPTPGNVLVPDVSSSDNNSFDNSIVSGDRIENRGGVVGGSGRFQRSSSLRSGTAAQQVGTPAASTSATPSTDYNVSVTQAQQHISKSMSTIASKNYEEDTVIYTSRAEANARARGNNYYLDETEVSRSRRGSAGTSGGATTSRDDIDDGEEDEDEEDEELDDEDYEHEDELMIGKRGGVRGSGGSRGSRASRRAVSVDEGELDRVVRYDDEEPVYRAPSRGSQHGTRASSTDLYGITKETQTPTHSSYKVLSRTPPSAHHVSYHAHSSSTTPAHQLHHHPATGSYYVVAAAPSAAVAADYYAPQNPNQYHHAQHVAAPVPPPPQHLHLQYHHNLAPSASSSNNVYSYHGNHYY